MPVPFPFVTSAVLLASELNSITELPINDKTASYTLVAGDAGEYVVMNSASATTITVPNSVFTASQIVYIVNKGTASTVVTAGAGTTVSTSGSLTVPANGCGRLLALSASAFIYEAGGITATTAGLTLISTTSIDAGVSSVTVSSAFSSTFDNYLVTISGGAASTTLQLTLQLGATTTGYTRNGIFMTFGSGTVTGFTDIDWRVGGGTTDSLNGQFMLFGPNLAKRTMLQTVWAQPETGGVLLYTQGILNDTTQYTAFTLGTTGGTMTGGSIRVYGYANS
jgi:hypothetical protein